jgi:hypothetical protein
MLESCAESTSLDLLYGGFSSGTFPFLKACFVSKEGSLWGIRFTRALLHSY